MSKAFVRESDSAEESDQPRRATQLPPGATNFLTAGGAKILRLELESLEKAERLKFANASPSDNTVRPFPDRRIHELREMLRSAHVVNPSSGPQEKVRFGAQVTVRSSTGEESTYRLVGVDETHHDPNNVSWVSPVGKALLNSSLGQNVAVQTPSGRREFEVIGIENG